MLQYFRFQPLAAGLAHHNVDSDFGSHTITQTYRLDKQR